MKLSTALLSAVALAAMSAHVEARNPYRPGAPMQMPTRSGTTAYRPTAPNIFQRAPLPVPNRVTVRHSRSK